MFALVFSITFENWDPFKLVGTLSITYMTSVLYIVSWIPHLKSNLNLGLFKKYAFPLILFIVAGLVSTALHSNYADEIKYAYNYRVLLLIILMFLLVSHFSNDVSLVSKALKVYIASIMLMFVLYQLGVGVEYDQGRLRIFGENPNLLGMKAVIALLIIIGGAQDHKFSLKRILFGALLIFPLLSLIIESGSRGAFLSIFIGLALIIFFKKMSVLKKVMLTIVGFLVSAFFFINVMQNNEVLQARLTRSIEKGDIGRSHVWQGALQVIENNIFVGVGFPGALPEMKKYAGRAHDPHNVFLYVWMTTGVIGFFFFMLFIWRMVKSLILSYRQTGKIVYLVIFMIILINMAKAGGGIAMILFYFFYSVLIGSTFIEEKSINLQQTLKS